MAIIHYDRCVIDIARRIAESPTAVRNDVMELIWRNEHRPAVRNKYQLERMPSSNYLGAEARQIILNIAFTLPNRRNNSKHRR